MIEPRIVNAFRTPILHHNICCFGILFSTTLQSEFKFQTTIPKLHNIINNMCLFMWTLRGYNNGMSQPIQVQTNAWDSQRVHGKSWHPKEHKHTHESWRTKKKDSSNENTKQRDNDGHGSFLANIWSFRLKVCESNATFDSTFTYTLASLAQLQKNDGRNELLVTFVSWIGKPK